ncbi:conserved hypothetical protein [Ricinus communis]|uniref:Uncharacterized protein n=1 Tax=Ricinus communis TaxID=3988 RepID=B9SPC0_RICCO|nr:conserved hypothetical protein [Ricinus communis]
MKSLMMKLLLVAIFIIMGFISFFPEVEAQKGPVPPSGAFPCVVIPGRGNVCGGGHV